MAQLRTLFGLPPTVLDDSKTDTFGVPATARGFADWYNSLAPAHTHCVNMKKNLPIVSWMHQND